MNDEPTEGDPKRQQYFAQAIKVEQQKIIPMN
jgi:hypothetical protein